MSRQLAVIGAAPLAAGALVPVSMVLDGPDLCPFRAATGMPCPLCGATRAFVLFGHADGRWLDYGAVWVAVAVAALVAGLAGRRLPRSWPALLAVAAAAWAWALAHGDTISRG